MMGLGLFSNNRGTELVPAVQHNETRKNRLAVKRGLQVLTISFLTFISAGIASAEVDSSSVSPATYAVIGQTLTFTINMNSENEIVDAPSVTSSIGVTYTCTPTSSGTTGVNFSCSGIHTVTQADINNTQVFEVATAYNRDGLTQYQQTVMQANFVGPAQSQTINFTDPADIAIATLNQQVNLVATATSGLTVSFSSATGAVCSVSGAIATVLTAGTCTINANQAGNAGFTAAPPVSQSFVISAIADTTPPVVTVPADISVSTDAGLATAAVTYAAASATDNVGVISGPTRTVGPASGAAFPVGTTIVTHTATDAAGNVGTASFNVTVTDNENPVVTVPADFTVGTDPGMATATVTYAVGATDNVGVISGPTLTQGLASGAAFPLGTTEITYTARDAEGNLGVASFLVGVIDDEAPVFTSTQPDIAVEVDFDQTSAIVTFPTPTASDNSGTVSVTQTEGPSSGDSFPVGTTQVEFTATDPAGQMATLQFSVTVSLIPPGTVTFVINSPDDGTVNFASSEAALTVAVAVSGGSGSSGGLQVVPGNYTASYSVPAGFAVTVASCNSSSGSVNVASQVITMSFARGESYICTLTALDIASLTEEQIQNFIDNRARQIIANQPDRTRRISRLTDRGNANTISVSGRNLGIEQLPFSIAVSPGAYDLSFSTSNLNYAPSISPPNWDVWFEASFSIYETGYGEGQFGIFHVGADYLIGSNALLGLGFQYDTLTEDVIGSTATASGDGWMVGPYFTARLSENFFFDATAKYGQAVNQISPLGTYVDEFSSERWLVSLALVGDFDMDAINVRPNLSLNYFEERTEAYVDSLAVPVASQATKLGDIELGSRFGWSGPTDRLSQHISVDGVYTFEASGQLDGPNTINTGLRGRVEYGGAVITTSGGVWDYTLTYDGLGDPDYIAATVSLGYSVEF